MPTPGFTSKDKPTGCYFYWRTTLLLLSVLLSVVLKLICVCQFRLVSRKTAVEYKRLTNFLTFCTIMHEAQASG